MKKTFFALLSVLLVIVGEAQVRLPSIIGDHMVLQQNTLVNIWGWCDVGEKISLKSSWDTAEYKATGTVHAKWSIQIRTPAAGGPYSIKIKGKNSLTIDDVLIGEVWLCSGQSNMEMSAGRGSKLYENDVLKASEKSIRFFHIPRTSAAFPQEDIAAKWVVCNPEDMRRFSLAGYFFGQKLNHVLGVPVGLINSSWGGTPAEVWTPKEAIEKEASLKQAADKLQPNPWGPVNYGYAYNAMISPITNFPIAGALWYQGEANVGAANTYRQLFSSMIQAWRAAWKKEFPFFFVQIAPFAGYGKDNINSVLLREAQTKTLSLPNTGMIVTTDLVDNITDIHPQQKKEVGLRLANYALAETYGKNDIPHKSPTFQRFEVQGDKLRIHFNDVGKGLIVRGNTLTEFYIAAQDKIFLPAVARIDGTTVVVHNKSVKKPVAVRFGFTNAAMPNLFSKDGLPVNIFRTDDWQ